MRSPRATQSRSIFEIDHCFVMETLRRFLRLSSTGEKRAICTFVLIDRFESLDSISVRFRPRRVSSLFHHVACRHCEKNNSQRKSSTGVNKRLDQKALDPRPMHIATRGSEGRAGWSCCGSYPLAWTCPAHPRPLPTPDKVQTHRISTNPEQHRGDCTKRTIERAGRALEDSGCQRRLQTGSERPYVPRKMNQGWNSILEQPKTEASRSTWIQTCLLPTAHNFRNAFLKLKTFDRAPRQGRHVECLFPNQCGTRGVR